ncbi:hypothetical protein ACFL6Y_08905 [Elusimicrobiota bacterium]
MRRQDQRLRLRSKALNWKRRKLLHVLRLPFIFLVFLVAASLTAHRMDLNNFFLVNESRLEVAADPQSRTSPLWRKGVQLRVEELWLNKNRAACILSAWEYKKKMLDEFKFIKSIDCDWKSLLINGKARLRVELRDPVARITDQDITYCLDGEGARFLCVVRSDKESLVLISGIAPSQTKTILRALPYLSLSLGPVKAIKSVTDSKVVMSDFFGRNFYFNLVDLDGLKLFSTMEQATRIMDDLKSREEEFNYMDLTYTRDDRIVVGG